MPLPHIFCYKIKLFLVSTQSWTHPLVSQSPCSEDACEVSDKQKSSTSVLPAAAANSLCNHSKQRSVQEGVVGYVTVRPLKGRGERAWSRALQIYYCTRKTAVRQRSTVPGM